MADSIRLHEVPTPEPAPPVTDQPIEPGDPPAPDQPQVPPSEGTPPPPPIKLPGQPHAPERVGG